jgi:hypothetical protein
MLLPRQETRSSPRHRIFATAAAIRYAFTAQPPSEGKYCECPAADMPFILIQEHGGSRVLAYPGVNRSQGGYRDQEGSVED